MHLLLLALESEPHMPFIPNAPVTMSARQHDTSPPSPHHLISPAGRTPCHAPLAYVMRSNLLTFALPESQLTASLLRRPNDRTSVIDDDGVRIDTDSQGERASENEPPAPRIPSQVSQEGVVENHHDPDMGIINVALDSSEGPMTSEEEMVSPLITLPLSRFHEPCEDSSDVLDFVHAELITPESSSTVIAAPPIFPCLPSVSDERRESVNVILGPAEAASVDISNTANVTDRLIKSAVPSRRCSRASSPLPELIEFVPQTPIRPPDPQPEASADIAPDNMQALLPLSASPVLPQSDLPAQEDQITIDVCIPNTPQSAIPPPPEIKKERKKHSIALPNDSRLRKRHRRTSEVENIDSFSVPESSTRASSDMTDASTGKRRATKRPGNSVSVSNETDEPSTSKPASAPLKVVQQRGRPTPYASDTPNAESPGMSDPNGSGGDLREDTDIPALIVDALVFGRLSFLSAPDLAKNILRDHPYLLERSGDQAAWVAIVRSVLETHSFFGRIPRCGLGPDGKKLEDTWYYEAARGKVTFPQIVSAVSSVPHSCPHLDPDRARAETLADFAPSRRRKAKMGDRTYFYAPVDMNRWVISAELGDDA